LPAAIAIFATPRRSALMTSAVPVVIIRINTAGRHTLTEGGHYSRFGN
jgi:hypothetical protein